MLPVFAGIVYAILGGLAVWLNMPYLLVPIGYSCYIAYLWDKTRERDIELGLELIGWFAYLVTIMLGSIYLTGLGLIYCSLSLLGIGSRKGKLLTYCIKVSLALVFAGLCFTYVSSSGDIRTDNVFFDYSRFRKIDTLYLQHSPTADYSKLVPHDKYQSTKPYGTPYRHIFTLGI
jgi:hypothetical protein